MGGEPILYALLGTKAMEMAAQREQQQDRRRILNTSLADAENTQRDAVQQVQAEAQQMAPEARLQQMAAAEQLTFDRTMGDIQGAGGAAVDTAAGGGAVSQDFTRALGERRSGENLRLSAIARELARVRAPQDVATEASMRRSAMAERLGSLWNSQRQRARAAEMDADAVDLPMYGQLASLANTAASAYAMAGGFPAPAAGAEAMSGMDVAADAPPGSGMNVGGRRSWMVRR